MSKRIEIGATILSVLVASAATYVSYLALDAAGVGNAAAARGVEIAELTRKDTAAYNQLSLKPILRFSYQLGGGSDSGFRFSVTNYGLGPAVVKSVSIKYRDRISNGDVKSLSQLVRGLNLAMATTSLSVGDIVEPSKPIDLFRSLNPSSDCALDKARKAFFEELDFIVEYESLYEISDSLKLSYVSPNDFSCR